MIEKKENTKNTNKILLGVRIFISMALMLAVCFFMRGRFNELLNTIRAVNIGLFLLTLAIAILIFIVHAFRLKLLFEIQKIYFTSIEAIKISFMGIFFNNFMPSTIGGDVVKLYYAKKRAKNFMEPLSAIVMDRILGLAALTSLGSLALIFKSELIKNDTAKHVILIFFLIIAGFFALIFFKGFAQRVISLFKIVKLVKLKRWIVGVIDTVFKFSRSLKTLYAFLLGLTGQLMAIYCIYLLSRSLSLNLPLSTFYVLVPVIQIVSVLPSIGGLGVREGAFVYFFKDFMTPEQALALSILYIGIIIPPSIAGGFIYMFCGQMDTGEVIV